ncbi:MAG: hypothetical protein ACRC33_31850 [Gemmataceae bacterium]
MGYVLIGLGVGAAAAAGGVLFVAWLERAGRARQELFQRRGVTAEATVEGAVLDDGLWSVTYRFSDRHGNEHAAIDFLDANRHEQPSDGSKVRVVYLPDQPWVSGVASMWLQARASVR